MLLLSRAPHWRFLWWRWCWCYRLHSLSIKAAKIEMNCVYTGCSVCSYVYSLCRVLFFIFLRQNCPSGWTRTKNWISGDPIYDTHADWCRLTQTHRRQPKTIKNEHFKALKVVNLRISLFFIIYGFLSRHIFRPIIMRFAANVSEASKISPIKCMTTAAIEFQPLLKFTSTNDQLISHNFLANEKKNRW